MLLLNLRVLRFISSVHSKKSFLGSCLRYHLPLFNHIMEDSSYHHSRQRPHPPPSQHHYNNRWPMTYPYPDPFFQTPRGSPYPRHTQNEFEFLPSLQTNSGGPQPSRGYHSNFRNWSNQPFGEQFTSSSLPPPPSSVPPHSPHMNFFPWNFRPPFIASHSDPHLSMNFHSPPVGCFSSNHQLQNKRTEKFTAPLDFGSQLDPQSNYQNYGTNGAEGSYFTPPKGEWHGGHEHIGGGHHWNKQFLLQSEVGTLSAQTSADSRGAMQSDKNGRMKKTNPQSASKSRFPLRPMVDINKELKVKHSTRISVVTYNVLAQDFVIKNLHLYSQCPPEHLEWEFRRDNILKELSQPLADILCLQEVQEEHYHSCFQPQLSKLGYSGVFKQRTGANTDGCALFYRHSKLKLLEWNGLEYQQRRIKVLNRDNVALLAKFAVTEDGVKNSNAVFCIANTHLLFNPKAGEVKLAQLGFLLAELHKMATKPGTEDTFPILLCGDLNSTPNSPLLSFITTATLNYSNLSALVIAGYFEDKAKSRVIPVPLFPKEMNIGANCTYRRDGSDMENRMANLDNSVRGYVNKDAKLERDLQSSNMREDGDCGQGVSHSSKFAQSTTPTHSEFTSMDTGEDSGKPMKTTRSVRGAKARGRVAHGGINVSDFYSLLESKSTTKGDWEYQSTEMLKSPTSGESSVDNSVVDVTEREQESMADCSYSCWADNSSTGKKLESSIYKNSSRTVASEIKAMNRKDITEQNPTGHKEDGVLTHPFKIVSAYPHSKSLPSTVTTYHQHAFETVDYILFSPISYKLVGSKKQLTGFNLLKRKALPSTHTLLDLGPQPHQYLSSDHLLLQATFQFSW